MGASQDLVQVKGLALLQAMPEDTQEEVAGLFVQVSEKIAFSDGEVVLHEGDLGGAAGFVLLDGLVEVERANAAPIRMQAPALLGEMHQFNPRAQRTATVRAKGFAVALKFSWQELYGRAKADLSERRQHLLMDGIERMVWQRFDRETLMDLALFRGLTDKLKLRVCLLLQWIAEPRSLKDGAVLFKQKEMCGAMGYLLTAGRMQISVAGQASRVLTAPDMVGVMPVFDPDLQWRATAAAQGDVQLLRFSWQHYVAMLQQRLTPGEQQQFADSLKAHAASHFVH